MREIVLDTETTGFDPKSGDRIVEIGCVELINRMATGKTYHQYINPERDMPEEAFKVHGLGIDYLEKLPVINDIMGDFLDFIGDADLVIHNAAFDMKFLNAELGWLGYEQLPMSRAVDTLAIARAKFPGAQVSLDALCRRYEIDNSSRSFHGALLDSELLAEVYLELTGGRQPGLELSAEEAEASSGAVKEEVTISRPVREARPHAPLDAELAAHAAFLESITEPIWNRE
ncbi:DNA polymerase III subunit epsilon [Aestuariispira insulae]|uniref:DNA polymerase III subunit epsilon n=1 Tax=Aestuariispira insulae TaxID=1461337 RepID=A0A3D9HPG5_9PROT|nr:DNA polymerase III subunit epsilon [Aestuariispira insulae]RED51370.1 DNA polymerase-3 subunit epsilon [Aestuariispira insulae]